MRRWLVQAHPAWWSLNEEGLAVLRDGRYATVARCWTRAGAESLRLRLALSAFESRSLIRYVTTKEADDDR